MVTIVCDTRQKLKHHEKKEQYFAEVGIKTLRSKLPCGDYARLDNMSVCIDTKQDLQECVGNICGKEHVRFRDECQLAQDNGIKLIILVEHSRFINSIDDVEKWNNPRQFLYEKKIRKEWGIARKADFTTEVAELKFHGAKIVRGPTTGPELAKCMRTMEEKYGVKFLFCDKGKAGERILELLNIEV